MKITNTKTKAKTNTKTKAKAKAKAKAHTPRMGAVEAWGCCSGADDPRSYSREALAAIL